MILMKNVYLNYTNCLKLHIFLKSEKNSLKHFFPSVPHVHNHCTRVADNHTCSRNSVHTEYVKCILHAVCTRELQPTASGPGFRGGSLAAASRQSVTARLQLWPHLVDTGSYPFWATTRWWCMSSLGKDEPGWLVLCSVVTIMWIRIFRILPHTIQMFSLKTACHKSTDNLTLFSSEIPNVTKFFWQVITTTTR